MVVLSLVTLPAVVVCALYGAWDAFAIRGAWADVAARLGRPAAVAALALYAPWAWLQQVLFQFHLLARPLARRAPAVPAVLNGLAFGLVHWPEADVALLATVGGVVWSAVYLRARCLVPIAVAHASAGTALFYWVKDTDLLAAVFG